MKKIWVLSIIFAVGIVTASLISPEASGQRSKLRRAQSPIANRYVVVLNEEIVGRNAEAANVESEAGYLAAVYGGGIDHIYSHAIKGFSAAMSPEQAKAMSDDERVLYIEEDAELYVASQQNAPWHLDRIDQRGLPLNTTYATSATGSGVHAYILDSGIRSTHLDFGGRASLGKDVTNDGQNGVDCTGHGTHVAGLLGSATYGVAKGVTLHSVKVIPCVGAPQLSHLVAGIDWVTANRVLPAVANISMTASGVSSFMETAISNSINSGVTYTVASGNNAADACSFSPGSLPAAITVGASYDLDARAPYSNFGPCVDIFAPGYAVLSTANSGDSDAQFRNGTSMSSPMVAGVAALFLQNNRTASPAAVAQKIMQVSTLNVLGSVGAGSPNRLLHSFLNGEAPPPPAPTPTPTPTPQLRGKITIKKVVRMPEGGPSSATEFPYAATNISTANFSLVSNEQFEDANVAPTASQTPIAVTEASVQGWRLDEVACVETSTGSPNVQNTTVDLANRRANILVEEGESITCTFTSVPLAPTSAMASISGRVTTQQGVGVKGVTISVINTRTGQTTSLNTGSFGHFLIGGLPAGDTYVMTARSRRHIIADSTRTFNLTEDLGRVHYLAE